MEHSHFGPQGAKVLAEALKHKNNKVTEINLKENDIESGVKFIIEALRHHNNKIKKIDLRINNIDLKNKNLLKKLQKDFKKKGRIIKILL